MKSFAPKAKNAGVPLYYATRIRDHQLMKMREKAGKYTSEGE
jgi:hypothetical protein